MSIKQLISELANEQIIITAPTLSSYLNRYQKMKQKESASGQLALAFAGDDGQPAITERMPVNASVKAAEKSAGSVSVDTTNILPRNS